MFGRTLIVGGSSGLGLEIARTILKRELGSVRVTGCQAPQDAARLNFRQVDLGGVDYLGKIRGLVHGRKAANINSLVLCLGPRIGLLDKVSRDKAERKIRRLCFESPVAVVKECLKKHRQLNCLLAVTSALPTPQGVLWGTFRKSKSEFEKHLVGLVSGGRIKRVLVVRPGPMKTRFWQGLDLLPYPPPIDPALLAEQLLDLIERREGNLMITAPANGRVAAAKLDCSLGSR